MAKRFLTQFLFEFSDEAVRHRIVFGGFAGSVLYGGFAIRQLCRAQAELTLENVLIATGYIASMTTVGCGGGSLTMFLHPFPLVFGIIGFATNFVSSRQKK